MDDYYAFKHDQGKPNPLLLERGLRSALDQVQRTLDFGALKYAPESWRNAPDAKDRCLAAALRHLHAYLGGAVEDHESGINHLAHSAVNLLFVLELEHPL